MKQLFDLTAEAFETVGVCLAVNAFGICKNNLQNVPAKYAELLVLAQSRPGPAAAVFLHDLIGATRQAGAGRRACRVARRSSDGGSTCSLFIVKRILWMVPSLFAVSFLAFVLIQLPPGDFVTTYIATLAASNEVVDQNTAADLRDRFGLDQPMIVQYFKWITGILLRGDFGLSFEWQQPVGDLIWERMALTLRAHLLDAARDLGHRTADRRLLGGARNIRSATMS